MVAIPTEPNISSYANDPLFPWLLSIKKELDDWYSGSRSGGDLDNLLSDCISTFKKNAQYRNDLRFLKIWFIYVIISAHSCALLFRFENFKMLLELEFAFGMLLRLIELEGSKEYESVFREMEENEICIGNSLLYEWYAYFLEAKGKWKEAHIIYHMGISRKAEPIEKLKWAQSLFVKRMSERLNTFSHGKGYHLSKKAYSGKVALSSLKKSSRNKIIEIGGRKYQIKGCAGQGGFAQVFKAYVDNNPDDVVALKIQKPAFPWEFYMYRQLDERVSGEQRSSFGFAHKIHIYSDWSILICDYLSHGTLQDAINSYVVTGKFMEEVLCIYYTMEMLYMLETLHGVGIIHGDFKPDNLLIRYSKDDLSEEGFKDRTGPWLDQGLYLVDWGRGIDLHLFPDNTEFTGDSRTSGFRCIEMQQNKPWTFQANTYGLCVAVHMMLHNTYMEIERKASDGDYIYLPKSSFKRYWNVDLWKALFTKLLNVSPGNNDVELLRSLRKSFLDYMHDNPSLIKKLRELLVKQRATLCSA
ncbi:hypothetical protein V6N13_098538 [Hibiscus sabdariffa]|uniref:Mitotic checkpoint serine/threonine-protein kinase BUB1 n=1 Tax=Hibiscus sabdariffa TaxID=183260 RepID=A0ABR2EE44_9ROSI